MVPGSFTLLTCSHSQPSGRRLRSLRCLRCAGQVCTGVRLVAPQNIALENFVEQTLFNVLNKGSILQIKFDSKE